MADTPRFDCLPGRQRRARASHTLPHTSTMLYATVRRTRTVRQYCTTAVATTSVVALGTVIANPWAGYPAQPFRASHWLVAASQRARQPASQPATGPVAASQPGRPLCLPQEVRAVSAYPPAVHQHRELRYDIQNHGGGHLAALVSTGLCCGCDVITSTEQLPLTTPHKSSRTSGQPSP